MFGYKSKFWKTRESFFFILKKRKAMWPLTALCSSVILQCYPACFYITAPYASLWRCLLSHHVTVLPKRGFGISIDKLFLHRKAGCYFGGKLIINRHHTFLFLCLFFLLSYSLHRWSLFSPKFQLLLLCYGVHIHSFNCFSLESQIQDFELSGEYFTWVFWQHAKFNLLENKFLLLHVPFPNSLIR